MEPDYVEQELKVWNTETYERYSNLLKETLNPILSKTESFPLYHYTTANALCSILQKGELWLTKWNCLNDPSEFQIIHEIIEKELKTYRLKNSVFYDLISDFNQIDQALKRSEEISSSTENIFILSFTRNHDALNMWTCYSKGGYSDGYSITFNKEPDLSLINHEKSNINLNTALAFTPVTYNSQEQKSLVKSFIELLYDAFEDPETAKGGKNDRDLIIFELFWSFTHQVGCRFKHEKYAQEEEVRAILCLPESEKHLIQHRALNGIIVPYISLNFDLQSIAAVCIGPTLRNKGAFSGIQSLKHSLGLSYGIFQSKIPFRII